MSELQITRWVMTAQGQPCESVSETLDAPPAGEVVVEVAGCGVCHTDISFLHMGVPTRAPLPLALGHAISGKVVEVGRIGKDMQGVINFTVTVELTDADALVRPGMTAEVDILIEEVENALLVPNKAVRLVDGDRVIYFLDEKGLPEMVEIRLGASADGMSILLSDNLEEGAEIILNPPSEPGVGSGPPGRMER